MTDDAPVQNEQVKKVIFWISTPKIFFYSLFYLVAILVAGTLTQSELGIYEAQERYFSAWVTWCFDAVPVPGGRTILVLISFNLFCKLVFKSVWRLKSMGVNIAHIGTMLLMVGALLTAYFSIEGSMYIPEGGSSRYYIDNEKMSFSIIDTSPVEYNNVMAFSGRHLHIGSELKHKNFPGSIKILDYHRNAALELTDEKTTGEWRGWAKRHSIIPKLLEKESGKNRAALVVKVSGCDESSNGWHMVAQVEGPTVEVRAAGKVYQLIIGPRVYQLPHNIRFELVDFIAEYHPGTRRPRHFSSDIRIHQNGTLREARIQMNEPLRMHGYTFYQSSFEQKMDGQEATILSVVKNYGQWFPYISSIIICIGIALHLLLHYPAYLTRIVRMWAA